MTRFTTYTTQATKTDGPTAIDIVAGADQSASSSGQIGNVTAATVIAFLSFLVIYALAGEPAAAIVFLGVLVGLVLILPLVLATMRIVRRRRLDDIRLAANLAAELAIQRSHEERRTPNA